MSQQNLLDITPNQLFETHFIADIDQVQKKIQYEIERKREELRAMVGERYRDLIQAADTIEEMKETTSSTLNHIQEMICVCKNLHDTHLVGFKISEKPQLPISYQTDSLQSISLQGKLLMEIPEKIWKCIETENYIQATQLFVFARHVNTGLQLHLGGKNIQGNMLTLQKFIKLQWHAISNFHDTIINECQAKLQKVDINAYIACSCLVSLYILDSKNMVDLLNSLIALHSNSSLKNTLHFELTHIIEGDAREQIKEKIVNSVKVVLKTVELVYACFVDKDGEAVVEKLKELFKKDSQPILELAHFSDPNILKFLPSVISNYRLTTNKDIQPLAKSDITDCLQKWSQWVKAFIDENLKYLLNNISKIKLLSEIREEAFKIEIPSNWSKICTSLSLPETHIWCHYFQPLLTNRIKEIIINRWNAILTTFKSNLLAELKRASAQDCIEKEADINWFVWKDLIGDTVIESRNEVVDVMISLMKGMSLQDQGFTPNLEKLCRSFDDELQRLLQDLSVYLYREKTGQEKNKILYDLDQEDETDQMFIDKTEIQMYLRNITEQNVLAMLEHIKICVQDPIFNSTELHKKTTSIYSARLIQAFSNLVPNLKKCYIFDQKVNFYDNVTANDSECNKKWVDIRGILKNNYIFCWEKWVDIATVKIVELTRNLPQEFTLEANIDYLMMQWDTILITEKDDDGNTVESTIKVPSGPSLKLQEYLYSISRILDEIVPHTLPLEIHTMYIDKLIAITFTHYNKVIREKETDINQRCALQLLMDVRHVTMLLVSRENTKYMELSHDVCEFLRQKIDPFDYDVFYPYIQTNLKRSVQRVQTLLGSLILHHGQLAGIVGSKPITSGGSADKSPNILTMASTDDTHWFTLLPVTAPVNLHKKIEKTKKKPPAASPNKSTRSEISELMTSSLPINLASARSNAASFFNDWFSGS